MRILIVDDESQILDLLEMQLRSLNCYVARANSGDAAMELLEIEKYDIVLTDMLMPGRPGIAVINDILNKEDDTHIAAMSAHINQVDLGPELMKKIKFLKKPWFIEDLKAIIEG